MGMGFAEMVLVGVILGFAGYALIVPIVGIAKAVRRKSRHEWSTGAVVWSGINVSLFALLAFVGIASAKSVVGPGIALALNGVWLALAIQANRAAARGRRPAA